MSARTTRFLGIALGASVSVTALQAGVERSQGPIAWGVDPGDPPDPPPADIHLEPGTGESGQLAFVSTDRAISETFAPHAVVLRGSATGTGITDNPTSYSPAAGDIEWVHSLSKDDDPDWANETYTAPDRLLTAFRRKGGPHYGQLCPFVFDEPGTYRHIMTAVMPNGTRATTTVSTITVTDPNDVFTAAQTYVVSGASNWDGAPSHNVGNRYTTPGAAMTAARTAGHARARISFRRGETYAGFGFGSTSTTEWLLDDYGTGTRPTFTSLIGIRDFGSTTARNVRVVNFLSQGDLNAITGTGNDDFTAYWLAAEPNSNTLFVGCGCRDVSSVVYCNPEFFSTTELSTNAFTAFYNCDFDNRVDAVYLIQDLIGGSPGSKPATHYYGYAFIGCTMRSTPGGLSMLTSSQGGGFNIRASKSVALEYYRQCDMFNNTGNNQSFGNLPYTQSNIRMATGYGPPTPGCQHVVSQCILEGGNLAARTSGYVSGWDEFTKQNTNFIIARNFFVKGSDLFDGFFTTANTGPWVRLNIVVITPTRTSTQFGSPGSYQSAVLVRSVDEGGYATGADDNPFKIYSNTLIVLHDYGNPELFANSALNPPTEIGNNLVHAPFTPGGLDVGPLVGEAFTQPLHQGFRNYVNTTMEPRTIPATHYVDVTGVTGTYNEGTTSNIVTLTAPGTVTASLGQVINTGGSTRRLYLYNVTGTIANGATVSVSGGNGGGSGTANGAMQATNFFRLWQPANDPGVDASAPFARVGFLGGLQTTAFRGALPQAV